MLSSLFATRKRTPVESPVLTPKYFAGWANYQTRIGTLLPSPEFSGRSREEVGAKINAYMLSLNDCWEVRRAVFAVY